MAKVVFESNNISDVFDGDISVAVSANRKKAIYTDDTTDGSLVFVGENLKKQDGDIPLLKAGTVEKLIVNDNEGILAGTMTGLDVKAKDLSDAFVEGGLFGMLALMLSGKDTILGSAVDDVLFGFGKGDVIKGGQGEDQITGGKGNDILTGGPESDWFFFVGPEDGKGADVITDFDVEGDVTDFLSFQDVEIESMAKANKNHDTLLTLTSGSSILLEGVTKAEFKAYLETVEF